MASVNRETHDPHFSTGSLWDITNNPSFPLLSPHHLEVLFLDTDLVSSVPFLCSLHLTFTSVCPFTFVCPFTLFTKKSLYLLTFLMTFLFHLVSFFIYKSFLLVSDFFLLNTGSWEAQCTVSVFYCRQHLASPHYLSKHVAYVLQPFKLVITPPPAIHVLKCVIISLRSISPSLIYDSVTLFPPNFLIFVLEVFEEGRETKESGRPVLIWLPTLFTGYLTQLTKLMRGWHWKLRIYEL